MRTRLLCGGGLILLVLVLASCGGSSNSQSNDQALAQLERATQAAKLQTDTGQVVDKLAADPSEAELADLRSQIGALQQRAGELAAGSATDPFGTDIVVGSRNTRVALVELVVVARDFSSDRARAAQRRALIRLRAANRRLRSAVGIAVAGFQGNGPSTVQQNSIDQIQANLTASDQAMSASFTKLGGLIDEKLAAAQAAATTTSQASGGCPPGTSLSPDGQLCSNGEPPSSSASGIQCQDVGSLTLAERQVCCTRSGIGCD